MGSKAFLCFLITFLLSTSAAAETYRWKDKVGKLHFGSTVPAEYAAQPYDIISKSGLVIGHVEPGSQSVEARIEAARQEALSQQSIEERQAQSDRLMLIKYPTEDALLESLQLELDQVGYDNRLITTSYNNTHAAIIDQIRLAADQQRAGIKVSDAQIGELERLHKDLSIDQRKLDTASSREDEVKDRFEVTHQRYLELVKKYNSAGDNKAAEKETSEAPELVSKDQS